MSWTFLTNHAQVLLCIARNPRATAHEIAQTVGITERAVQRILHDLHEAGYVSHVRESRHNLYTIYPDRPLRHSAQQGLTVGDLLAALVNGKVEAGEIANTVGSK
ncbi:helix-turn-helix transcriptional regulator [Chloroflexus sp.]|uniref:helix-turn-helix transcriptional regulator n=1 Tax=Chloroflexus sp. TaxID=1904827 RepID=UPI0026361F9E|nr:helix-turn-helix domain-containing protein [uncultured Chloroflexus sp.]